MNKDYDVYILFIVGIIVAGGIYFGVVTAIKKAFKPSAQIESLDSTETKKTQADRTEEIQRQHKELLRRQEQQMRDYRRSQR